MIEIRPASLDDAPGMARVIVDTWFAAHEGQVSDDVFRRRRDEWGYAESEQGWRRSIQEADGRSAQMYVAMHDDEIVGIAATNVTREGEVAEVGALYVDVPHQHAGIGRRLVDVAMQHYRRLGITKLQIAVLATNAPARGFYERIGGRIAGTRDDEDGTEIVYEWDLRSTASAT